MCPKPDLWLGEHRNFSCASTPTSIPDHAQMGVTLACTHQDLAEQALGVLDGVGGQDLLGIGGVTDNHEALGPKG
eukprot:1150442-Pelagomonas_calceolata.AAC.2